MHIFVPKFNRFDGKSPKFHPHYNAALGKHYYEEREMRRDMDARGLEFAKEGDLNHEPKRKKYALSSETKSVIKAINDQSKKGKPFKPSGRLLDVLAARQQASRARAPKNASIEKGGFDASDS